MNELTLEDLENLEKRIRSISGKVAKIQIDLDENPDIIAVCSHELEQLEREMLGYLKEYLNYDPV